MPPPQGQQAVPVLSGTAPPCVTRGAPRVPTCVKRLRLQSADGKDPSDLKLAAVVVTICNGSSYDDVFARVAQEGIEGTYVATYRVSGPLAPVLTALRSAGGPAATAQAAGAGDLRELLEHARAADPASVVFNWECCCACSQESFGDLRESEVVLDLMELLLQRGHMVMCSDFSLKALIKSWSTRRFGPNPFVKLGEFQGNMHLHFDAEAIRACPSSQLQRAGDLCGEGGEAVVRAMGGTIVYTVDRGVPGTTNFYTLQVLTVATEISGFSLNLPEERTCEAAGKRGAAGHVLLTFRSGGTLLASAGHWGELVQMDVTEERLLETAAATYGAAYASDWAAQLASAPAATRSAVCQSLTMQMVTQSPPCSMVSAPPAL